jgi:tetratricopeptide (TPR) repeat protein
MGMEILALIFSGPGATISVCVTVLILVGTYLLFSEKFRGLSVGYKEFKVETPKLPASGIEAPAEVIQDPKEGVEPKTLDASNPPFLALFDAVERQDRAGIEAAIEKMRDDPPFGFKVQELEALKFSELLNAGFTDAIENLKEIEKNQTGQILASLYLARYYFRTRSDGKAEEHLKIAEERAFTDDRKVDVALLRAEMLDFTKGKETAIAFLDGELGNIGDNKQRFRLFREIGNLSSTTSDKAKAIVAYEKALQCEPENIETRFKLALIYGTTPSLKMLGIRHYRIIHEQNHLHTSALHNLGLLYGELGLPISKIRLIKRAAEQKDGHALGNLAHFYIENGFVDDADKILREIPSEIALSERVIAAQQYLRRSEQENDANKEKLIHSAENLSNLVTDYDLVKQFEPSKYIGGWIDTKDEKSTLDIEMSSGLAGYCKLTIQGDRRRIFAYTYLFSPIAQIDFSTIDKQPSSVFWTNEGEIKTAVLFGEDALRVIETEGIQIKSSRDYRRASK